MSFTTLFSKLNSVLMGLWNKCTLNSKDLIYVHLVIPSVLVFCCSSCHNFNINVDTYRDSVNSLHSRRPLSRVICLHLCNKCPRTEAPPFLPSLDLDPLGTSLPFLIESHIHTISHFQIPKINFFLFLIGGGNGGGGVLKHLFVIIAMFHNQWLN